MGEGGTSSDSERQRIAFRIGIAIDGLADRVFKGSSLAQMDKVTKRWLLLLVTIPTLAAIAVLGSLVSEARRAPESKPQEKTAPAIPKKAGEMLQKDNTFYIKADDTRHIMAFGRRPAIVPAVAQQNERRIIAGKTA